MNLLRATLLTAALALAACSSEVTDTPCTPACRAGETCSFGVCQVYCNPTCGASQQCLVINGATQCVGVDAGTARDGAPDQLPGMDAPADTSDEVPTFDVAPDLATEPPPPLDAPAEAAPDGPPAPDGPAPDLAPDLALDRADATAELPAMDAPDAAPDATADRVDATAEPAPMDAAAEMPAMDAPRDAAAEPAPMDAAAEMPAPDAPTLPPCGASGQPCCGGPGSDVACRAGLVCNAFENGRCVAATSPEPLECSSSSACTAGRVCQGAAFCGSRACMRCAPAGMLAYDAPCASNSMGVTCSTGVCLSGRCSWACAPGTAGDAECSRRAPNTRCQEAYYGINFVSMRPTAWVTLGGCAPVCRRNGECTMGRACGAIPSLLDDRIEYYCIADGRMPTGSTCTSGDMCQSLLCLSIPGVGRRCTTPCVADTDCPAAQRCGDIQLLRPVSGAEQPSRGCLPR